MLAKSLLFCLVGLTAYAREKRVLLHSDLEIEQVVSSLQAEVSALKSKVATLESNLLNAPLTPSSVYIRWGRTSCPGNGTELVYHGRMAGSLYNKHGGGANSLCLPDDPTWSKQVNGFRTGATIHGTEIDIGDSDSQVLFGKHVNQEDIPCALCRTSRPSNAMIPGRADCYPGWTLEYQGYVVSGQEEWNNNVDFACLDAGLEFAPHGGTNDDEHVLHVVEVMCGSMGSLPCPPYVNGSELACVVCSK